MTSKRAKSWSIVIPASVNNPTSHLRGNTLLIGQIARAAGIDRIDEIIIYPPTPSHSQSQNTDRARYLRNDFFPITKTLRVSGTLPPLRTPHHPRTRKVSEVNVGDYREGVVMKILGEHTLINIGLDVPAVLKGNSFPLNTRITTQIS